MSQRHHTGGSVGKRSRDTPNTSNIVHVDEAESGGVDTNTESEDDLPLATIAAKQQYATTYLPYAYSGSGGRGGGVYNPYSSSSAYAAPRSGGSGYGGSASPYRASSAYCCDETDFFRSEAIATYRAAQAQRLATLITDEIEIMGTAPTTTASTTDTSASTADANTNVHHFLSPIERLQRRRLRYRCGSSGFAAVDKPSERWKRLMPSIPPAVTISQSQFWDAEVAALASDAAAADGDADEQQHMLRVCRSIGVNPHFDCLRRFIPSAALNARVILWRGDITTLEVGAILNAAKESLMGGGGIDGAIHGAAGPLLKEACRVVADQWGGGCPTGQTRLTRGFALPAAYVLHTVGPIGGGDKLLDSCYGSALDTIAAHNAAVRSLNQKKDANESATNGATEEGEKGGAVAVVTAAADGNPKQKGGANNKTVATVCDSSESDVEVIDDEEEEEEEDEEIGTDSGNFRRSALQARYLESLRNNINAAVDAADEIITSVALCGVSTGIFGFPLVRAAHIALRRVREWLEADSQKEEKESSNENETPSGLRTVIFCCFNEKEHEVYRQLLPSYFPHSTSFPQREASTWEEVHPVPLARHYAQRGECEAEVVEVQ